MQVKIADKNLANLLSEMMSGMIDKKKNWICEICGHEVTANKPEPIRWIDGHVCQFVELEIR
ncbi:hypothetical protein ES705_25924 [subsurface metagenome]